MEEALQERSERLEALEREVVELGRGSEARAAVIARMTEAARRTDAELEAREARETMMKEVRGRALGKVPWEGSFTWSLGKVPWEGPSGKSRGKIPLHGPLERSLGEVPWEDPSGRSLGTVPWEGPLARCRGVVPWFWFLDIGSVTWPHPCAPSLASVP